MPPKVTKPLELIEKTFVVSPESLKTSKRSAVGLATLGARVRVTAFWFARGWAMTAFVVVFVTQLEGHVDVLALLVHPPSAHLVPFDIRH